MRYESGSGSAQLMDDAVRVSKGVAANQSQESLDDQLKDMLVLATRFGLYDAADWLKDLLGHRERFQQDYGELPT
jgi:CRISPR/Cas system-associated protein Csm6